MNNKKRGGWGCPCRLCTPSPWEQDQLELQSQAGGGYAELGVSTFLSAGEGSLVMAYVPLGLVGALGMDQRSYVGKKKGVQWSQIFQPLFIWREQRRKRETLACAKHANIHSLSKCPRSHSESHTFEDSSFLGRVVRDQATSWPF